MTEVAGGSHTSKRENRDMAAQNHTEHFEAVKKIISRGQRCDHCKKLGAIKSLWCNHRLCLPCALSSRVPDMSCGKYPDILEEVNKDVTWVEGEDNRAEKEQELILVKENLSSFQVEEVGEDLDQQGNGEKSEPHKNHIDVLKLLAEEVKEGKEEPDDMESHMENTSSVKVIYKCPVSGCNTTCTKEERYWKGHDLDHLKILVLHSAADRMKGFEKQDLCEMCKTHDLHINPASYACIQCRQFLCDNCVEIHQDKKTFFEHSILPSSDGLSHVLMGSCRKHNDLQLYCCLDCFTPMCPSCVVNDIRPNHTNDIECGDNLGPADAKSTLLCSHNNLQNLNEHENIWETERSLQEILPKLQKEIMMYREQQSSLKSWYNDANQEMDKMLQELLDLHERIKKQKELLQDEYSTKNAEIANRLDILMNSNEEVLHYKYAQAMVTNSQLAQFCLTDTLKESFQQHAIEIKQIIRQEKINLRLPKIQPLAVEGGTVKFVQEEEVKKETRVEIPKSKNSLEVPKTTTVQSRRSSSSGSGYESIEGRSSHTYESIPSSYMKILSTTSSSSYQELLIKSQEALSTSGSSVSPPTVPVPKKEPKVTPKEPKRTRPTLSKNSKFLSQERWVKRSGVILTKRTKQKFLDIFKEPSAQRLVRKISRFETGTLCC